MVATDSGTLLKELGRQSEGADPRDAGLDTWTLLMNMIGRSETARENAGGFDDLVSFQEREHRNEDIATCDLPIFFIVPPTRC